MPIEYCLMENHPNQIRITKSLKSLIRLIMFKTVDRGRKKTEGETAMSIRTGGRQFGAGELRTKV